MRGRWNERGDFLVATVTPADERATTSSQEMFFPHLADSGGYSTEVVVYSGTASTSSSGVVRFVTQSGGNLDVQLSEQTSGGPGLLLSTNAGAPGGTLVIRGSGFDAQAFTYVTFANGDNKVRVRSAKVSSTSVEVSVPVFWDARTFRIGSGTVSVSVEQETATGTRSFGSVTGFNISALPAVAVQPGSVVRAYLDQMASALEVASNNWQRISRAGGPNVSELQVRLLAIRTQTLAQRDLIQQLMDGTIDRIQLNRTSATPMTITRDSLGTLDSLISVYLLSGTGLPLVSSFQQRTTEAVEKACSDPVSCLRERFDPTLASKPEEIFEKFHKLESLAEGVAGVAALIADIVKISAPALDSRFSTPFIYMTTVVMPALAGFSALSFAAPFIELELGHAPSCLDYQVALNYLRDGSIKYIKTEALNGVIRGLEHAGFSEAEAEAIISAKDSLSVIDAFSDRRPSLAMDACDNFPQISVNLQADTKILRLTTIGSGSGVLRPTSIELTCGNGCYRYPVGTRVEITQSPGTGATFIEWSGGCTGSGTCNVAMTTDVTVTGRFDLQGFNLTVTKAGAGSGTVQSVPTGIQCDGSCTGTFSPGTTVTLTATASQGSIFDGWSGACTGTGSCVVRMDSAKAVTATFSLPVVATVQLTSAPDLTGFLSPGTVVQFFATARDRNGTIVQCQPQYFVVNPVGSVVATINQGTGLLTVGPNQGAARVYATCGGVESNAILVSGTGTTTTPPPAPTTSGTYTGFFGGKAPDTKTFPPCVFEHSVTGTLILTLRGAGTAADPYAGTMSGDGKDVISVTKNNVSNSCFGDTITAPLTGTISGSAGKVEARGRASAAGTTVQVNFTNGQFSGSILQGTLTLENEFFDQPIVVTISLVKSAAN